ncbi:hypothetical protein NEOLEDRAFT_1180692 [Neolentinus lepideus HHB14362 ss-1]|uniref:Uncharacterized protein n=1 Tax=Neolentinus lepideus HHB14362 ss-1 TaxID=1314782 RepID=A0A165QRV6_9AGAM|nr:hypothetical protein NEOLEDRAFT_1180692 [Neolentinus lepideus HHB14362 ss-1]
MPSLPHTLINQSTYPYDEPPQLGHSSPDSHISLIPSSDNIFDDGFYDYIDDDPHPLEDLGEDDDDTSDYEDEEDEEGSEDSSDAEISHSLGYDHDILEDELHVMSMDLLSNQEHHLLYILLHH